MLKFPEHFITPPIWKVLNAGTMSVLTSYKNPPLLQQCFNLIIVHGLTKTYHKLN